MTRLIKILSSLKMTIEESRQVEAITAPDGTCLDLRPKTRSWAIRFTWPE